MPKYNYRKQRRFRSAWLCGHLSLQPDCPFFSNRKAAALYREISGKNRGNSLGRGYQFRLYTDRIHISWRTPESYAGNSQRKPLNLQRLSSGSIPSLSDRSALFWGKKLWSIRYDRYERSLYGSTKGFVIRSRSFYRACYESPDSGFSFAGWRKLLCYTAFTGISGRWAFYLLLSPSQKLYEPGYLVSLSIFPSGIWRLGYPSVCLYSSDKKHSASWSCPLFWTFYCCGLPQAGFWSWLWKIIRRTGGFAKTAFP